MTSSTIAGSHFDKIVLVRSSYFISFASLIILITSAIWVRSISFEKKREQNSWSEPINIYSSPDSTDFFVFDADVHAKTINVVKTHFDTTGSHLNYSEVFLLKKKINGQSKLLQISKSKYPVEAHPVIYRTKNDNLHLFWGERRIDPNFEEYNRSGVDLLFNISTTLMHTEIENNIVGVPEVLYDGSLSKIFGGNGDLTLPTNVIENEDGQLHLVIVAEGNFEEINGNHSLGLGYIKQNDSNSWDPIRLMLATKFNPDISAISKDQLVLAFRGSDRFDPQGSSNDINLIRSENSGDTWSDEQVVFRSGEQTTNEVQLLPSPNGKLHLIWSRYLESGFNPFSDEAWHSVSGDGGISWSEPERFFKLETPSEKGYYFFRGMDSVVDRYGQVHWVLVSAYGKRGDGKREERDFYYTKWSPDSGNWTAVEKLDFAERPLVAKLSIDEISNKLYLFWDERDERAIYYSTKEISKSELLPVIAKSGPLQLNANYPNPFNPSTRISFTLEEPAEVTLTIYDISGRQIMQENLGTKQAGLHTEEVNLEGFTSGTYIYEVELNNTWRQQSTMMLIK